MGYIRNAKKLLEDSKLGKIAHSCANGVWVTSGMGTQIDDNVLHSCLTLLNRVLDRPKPIRGCHAVCAAWGEARLWQ